MILGIIPDMGRAIPNSPALTGHILPAIVAGLYVWRLLAEWTAWPGIAGAVLALIAVSLVARRLPAGSTWPLLMLLGYVAAPEPDPLWAILAAVATALALAIRLLPPPAPDGEPLGNEARRDGLILAAAFLALFIATASRGIAAADNGELQLVATRLGVAHPPGFPLYTMLAHLASRLPLPAGPAAGVNLLSALFAAATVGLTAAATTRLAGWRPAGWVAGIALGTATTFWTQAGVANIRSLTAFFAAAAVLALVRLWREPPSWPALALFVISLSLGVTHHPSLAFPAIAWALAATWRARPWRLTGRRKLALTFAALCGVVPLLYLPWRAAAGAWGAPPDLGTWSGFWRHVLARGFAGDLFYFTEIDILAHRLGVMADIFVLQFGAWPLALGALALVPLLWRRRGLALSLALAVSVALPALITATYRAPQSTEYLMPAYVPAALLIGAAPAFLVQPVPPSWRRPLATLLATGLLVAVLTAAWTRGPSLWGVDPTGDVYGYTNRILEEAPPDATVLANWHWVTPLWYRQEVDGARPDLTIRYIAPEGEPYAQTWAAAIAAELDAGREVVATWFDADAYAGLPAPEPLGEAFWFRQHAREAPPAGFQTLALEQDGVRWHGVRLDAAAVPLDGAVVATVAWEVTRTGSGAPGLYAHLIAPDGALLAQADLPPVNAGQGLQLSRFVLTLRPGAAPGPAMVALGVAGGAAPRTTVAEIALEPATLAPLTGHRVYRTLPSGRPLLRLIGYDWDTTIPGRTRLYLHWQTELGYQTEVRDNVWLSDLGLPPAFGPWGGLAPIELGPPADEHYVPLGRDIIWRGGTLAGRGPFAPGETLVLAPRFTSARAVSRDLVVSLRLVGYEADGVRWDWWDLDDGVPALGAIPTLKWVRGYAVRDPHRLQVAATATPGQSVGALLRLYDAFTGQPVPIRDEGLAAEAPWIPLGNATVERSPTTARGAIQGLR